jgi:hypothetical protein
MLKWMDFLDPKKKRAHKIRLFIGYALMAVVLAIGTFILLLEVSGLSLHPSTGTVTQNGLVFVDAHPESATIYLNGQEKGQTDTRLVLPSGNYALELKRNGYRGWKRSFVLGGSTIERFIYPFLFPEKLVSKDIQLYSSTPTLATESPDRHWLVVQQPGSITNFDIIDISNSKNTTTTLSLPATIVTTTGTSHSFELVEWSTDNRRVLVKHNFEGGNEFLVIDREDAASSQNLNKALGQPIFKIALRDKKYDQYYLLNTAEGSLISTDLKSKQIVPIANKVLHFKPYGSDIILFATADGAEAGKAIIKIRQDLNQYALRTVSSGGTYLLDLARFDSQWYMAAGSSVEQKVYVYKEPFDDLRRSQPRIPIPISVLRTDGAAEFVSFSTIARFVAVQSGSQFAVYDAETKRQYRYDTKLELPAHVKANWMDGHRLTVISKDTLVIFDYDGINQQTLLAANAAFQPFFDRDYTAMFTISPSVTVPSRTAVVRTELLVK